MATSFYAQPVTQAADADRFLEILADLRASVDDLEHHASTVPHVARTRVSRLRTIAASARELATSVSLGYE